MHVCSLSSMLGPTASLLVGCPSAFRKLPMITLQNCLLGEVSVYQAVFVTFFIAVMRFRDEDNL